LETYDALKRDLESDDLLVGQFLTGNPDYAIVLLKAGKRDEALPILETVVGQRLKTLGDKAFAVAQARGWLAAGLAQAGQTQRALETFESAVPILLTASRQAEDAADDGASLAQNEQQTQQIVEAYLALLADTKGSAAAADAFRLADAVRGRSVQRALSASAARASVSDAALARLVRYEQDAQKQIAALQGLLANILTRPTSEQDANAVKKLREDIDRLRTSRARLREEIERRFPDYVNLIDPKPASVEQAQKSLRPGEALIATYAGSERLFVWAVPVQGAVSFAAAKVTDRDVETMVVGLRKALDPSADTLDAVPAFDVALANKLYDLLLKPVEAGWKDAKSLMVVPHKALGQLPTAVLVTEKVAQPAKAGVLFAEYKNVPFLARKVAVTQLPSVTSLATLRALPAPAANRATFVAFGDPWFSPEQASEARQQVAANTLQTRGRLVRRNAPKTEGVDSAELAQLPRLPDTAEEVRSIALALKADRVKDVFIGETANEKTVKTMDLSKRKIVMFATHGLVPGDLNGLTQPALAMTAPAVAKVDGDGLLTMEEVLALKLNADWVVLSACNTATGSGAGAEAVSGLGRAFFYAGTRALLVSNWPVETVSARTLTTDLFRRQAEDPKLARAEAMRQAEVALIDGPGALDEATRQPMFSYAHPIFWAPFSVVGDGG
jgi:CHAT domain-containing protein